MVADVRLPAFFRLDAANGWHLSAASVGVRISPRSGEVELGFIGTRLSPLTEPHGSFGGLTLPTGVAIDSSGVVLVASPESGEILRHPHPALFPERIDDQAESEGSPLGFAPLWPGRREDAAHHDQGACHLESPSDLVGVYELVRPRGLAFSYDGDLLVVDEGDEVTGARLLVYAWPSVAVRHARHIGGRPCDVAVDSNGRIYVADARAGRVRRFTRQWIEDAWPGGDGFLNEPRHLVIDRSDQVFVVDRDAAGTSRLSHVTVLGGVEVLDVADETAFWQREFPAPIQERAGNFYAPGDPCVAHGRRLRDVVVDRRGRLPQGPAFVYRAPAGRRERTGVFLTDALDSESFNFAWHRLLLELEYGAAGAVTVESFTAAHYMEPDRIARLPEQAWSPRTVLTADLERGEVLVGSDPGRYLWLRVGLVGDGVDTPRLRSIEVLGPRRSSLRFLPAPFHDDPVSRRFLDRFLSYFDTIFDEARHTIERFPGQLTPQGAPEGAFLSWLASWFDIDLLADWSDGTRRAFLTNAMNLHRSRGTIAGLEAVLRLHLGVQPPLPVLIEGFRLRDYLAGDAVAALPHGIVRVGGVPLTTPPDDRGFAHRFYVAVPDAVAKGSEARDTLQRLVDRFRPAHTTWSLITIGAGVRVGCQSMIGVDTLVGTYPSEPLGDMALGQSAQLMTEHSNTTRIGTARLGTSPVL